MTRSDALALVIAVLAAGHLASGNRWGNALAILALVVLLLDRPLGRKLDPTAGTPIRLVLGTPYVLDDETRWQLDSIHRTDAPGRPAVLQLDLRNITPR